MQIIAIAATKGGTGKTTTAAALAQAAAADGKTVLAIDLDPQCNLSFALGADSSRHGAYNLLQYEPPKGLIQHTEQNIDVIAGSPDLSQITTSTGSAKRLREALKPIKGIYDFIFIDCPPMMGELQFNALAACTGLLIPLETDGNSLQALYNITDIAGQFTKINPQFSIIGTILTRYDPRPKVNRYLQEVIAAKGEEVGAVYLGAIRSGVAVREAAAMQQSLFTYAPTSKPAEDYKTIYKKITGV